MWDVAFFILTFKKCKEWKSSQKAYLKNQWTLSKDLFPEPSDTRMDLKHLNIQIQTKAIDILEHDQEHFISNIIGTYICISSHLNLTMLM